MTFQQFTNNIVQWSADRGIYQHSTYAAQLLKGLSELGELADAIVKNRLNDIKDAIGDIAVCLINASTMSPVSRPAESASAPGIGYDSAESVVSSLCYWFAGAIGNQPVSYDSAMRLLRCAAEWHGLDFIECCESAWLEIKDRRGQMVPGGAFVKEGGS